MPSNNNDKIKVICDFFMIAKGKEKPKTKEMKI